MQAPWVLAYLIVGDREPGARTGPGRRAAQGDAPRRVSVPRRSRGRILRGNASRGNASRDGRQAPPRVMPLPGSAAYQGDVADRARRR